MDVSSVSFAYGLTRPVAAPDRKFRWGRFWVVALIYEKHFVNFIF